MIADIREHVEVIKNLLKDKDYRVLRSIMSDYEAADVAEES